MDNPIFLERGSLSEESDGSLVLKTLTVWNTLLVLLEESTRLLWVERTIFVERCSLSEESDASSVLKTFTVLSCNIAKIPFFFSKKHFYSCANFKFPTFFNSFQRSGVYAIDGSIIPLYDDFHFSNTKSQKTINYCKDRY